MLEILKKIGSMIASAVSAVASVVKTVAVGTWNGVSYAARLMIQGLCSLGNGTLRLVGLAVPATTSAAVPVTVGATDIAGVATVVLSTTPVWVYPAVVFITLVGVLFVTATVRTAVRYYNASVAAEEAVGVWRKAVKVIKFPYDVTTDAGCIALAGVKKGWYMVYGTVAFVGRGVRGTYRLVANGFGKVGGCFKSLWTKCRGSNAEPYTEGEADRFADGLEKAVGLGNA